ncbi:MAG TPA: hypothetical protein PKE45_12175, partial [Caldilineaceae bacterium]|nr:hypothetical protein [Caldilineaceae bacterium]
MELLTTSQGGSPQVSAFRNVTLDLFGWPLPLMVQDYIGALNVYLALPFLALTGIGVPNLRIVAAGARVGPPRFLARAVCSPRAWHPPRSTP